jgi:hypothetical protein
MKRILTKFQIECLCEQVRQVILYGIASHDGRSVRNGIEDRDIADAISLELEALLYCYSWTEN